MGSLKLVLLTAAALLSRLAFRINGLQPRGRLAQTVLQEIPATARGSVSPSN